MFDMNTNVGHWDLWYMVKCNSSDIVSNGLGILH